MKFTYIISEFSLLRGPNIYTVSYRTSKFDLKSVVQQFTMILKLGSPLSTCCCILQQQQMEDTRKAGGTMTLQHQTPPVPVFDSTAELWRDYLLRFETFDNDTSVPDEKKALVFLTNQTSGTYKLITNYASQQDVPTTVGTFQ